MRIEDNHENIMVNTGDDWSHFCINACLKRTGENRYIVLRFRFFFLERRIHHKPNFPEHKTSYKICFLMYASFKKTKQK